MTSRRAPRAGAHECRVPCRRRLSGCPCPHAPCLASPWEPQVGPGRMGRRSPLQARPLTSDERAPPVSRGLPAGGGSPDRVPTRVLPFALEWAPTNVWAAWPGRMTTEVFCPAAIAWAGARGRMSFAFPAPGSRRWARTEVPSGAPLKRDLPPTGPTILAPVRHRHLQRTRVR